MKTRCKCYVANLESTNYYSILKLNLVYSNIPETENYRFHSASPSGNIKITAHENGQELLSKFRPGSFWYVDTSRVESISASNVKDVDYVVLSAIDHNVTSHSSNGEIVSHIGNTITVKLRGFWKGLAIEQEVYIANQHVYDQFTEVGDLYLLTMTETTKEGTPFE